MFVCLLSSKWILEDSHQRKAAIDQSDRISHQNSLLDHVQHCHKHFTAHFFISRIRKCFSQQIETERLKKKKKRSTWQIWCTRQWRATRAPIRQNHEEEKQVPRAQLQPLATTHQTQIEKLNSKMRELSQIIFGVVYQKTIAKNGHNAVNVDASLRHQVQNKPNSQTNGI